MPIDFDALKSSFINLCDSRLNDLELSESEIFTKLCEKYGYSGETYQLQDFIRNKIKELCCFESHLKDQTTPTEDEKKEHGKKAHEARLKRQNGEWFTEIDIKCLANNLYLESMLCDKEIAYAQIALELYLPCCMGEYYSLDKPQDFFDLCFDYYLIDNMRKQHDNWFEGNGQMVGHPTVLVEAVKYFDLKPDDFEIFMNKVLISNEARKAIHKQIEDIIQKIGGIELINLLFEFLKAKQEGCESYYNEEFDRYLICRDKHMDAQKTQPLPFNYLIQTAVKFLNSKPNNMTKNERSGLFTKLGDISSKYVELFDVYNPNIHSDIQARPESISQYLYDEIRFETLCIPEQYSPKFIELLIKELYIPSLSQIEGCPDLYKSNNFAKLISEILKYSPCSTITAKKLGEKVRLNTKNIREFLVHFSQKAEDVNAEFTGSLEKTTLGNVPLIQLSEDEFFLVSPHFNGYGFCAKIYDTISQHCKNYNRVLGIDYLEPLVKKLLSRKRYSYKCGYYGPKGKKRECDLILETDEKILFVEIKNAGLPQEIELGDDVAVLARLGKDMLYAQMQVIRHKVYLKQNGNKMNLYNEQADKLPAHPLSADNKRIYAVSLSSAEYAFLTAGTIANQLLKNLMHGTYHANDENREQDLEALNETGSEVQKLTEQYVELEKDITSRDFCFYTSFKSLQQFWVALNKSSSLDEFIDYLTHDIQWKNSSVDFYASLINYTKPNPLRDMYKNHPISSRPVYIIT